VDQSNTWEGKPVILVLSDAQLPVGSWTKEGEIEEYREHHVFTALVFVLDKNRKVILAEYYDGGEPGPRGQFPTQTIGVFDLKLEGAGKSLTGSAHSTPAMEKATHPMTLDVAFSVAVP
jgi:hypothetical protein